MCTYILYLQLHKCIIDNLTIFIDRQLKRHPACYPQASPILPPNIMIVYNNKADTDPLLTNIFLAIDMSQGTKKIIP